MEVLKKYKNQIFFHFILNLACAVLVTFASFSHYPLGDIKGFLFYMTHFLALQFSVFGLLYFMSIYRIVFVMIFPIVFVFFSMVAFWVYTQDIAISHGIVQVAAETKPDVILDLIGIPFVAYLILSVATVFILLKLHRKIGVNQWKSPLIVLAVFAIITYNLVENYKYGAFTRRLPYNVFTATNEYLSQNQLQLKPITQTFTTANDSLNIVFILGETVRADHLQLNGYQRETTPLLSKRKNIISFPNAYTPMTYTAESLPQLFTDATFTDDYSEPKYALIDVLNQANIQTNWIGNQTPEKSYEVFIERSSFHKIIDPLHSELSFQKAYDEALLPLFSEVYKPFKKQFTTIHMMGSHWWYETRYPDTFRKYKPVISSKHISSNSKDEMINSYDNTILYLDYFLDKIISQVEKQDANTLVIYLSDHGELLGENNQWLHAQPGKSVSNPGMLIWYSEKFEKKNTAWAAQLKTVKNQKTDLEFFFPTIIQLYGIKGFAYEKNKSLLQ